MTEQLIVISSFPEKGLTHGKAVVGIASYTKNTLLSLKKNSPDTKITVLAENLIGQEKYYEDNGIFVKRVWKRNSIFSFFKLLYPALASKNILIEFEVAMFGEFIYLLPFPIFLLVLKLLGKKVTIVSHQVISDIETLSGHINLNSKSKSLILNYCIHLFYRIILLLTTKVIVFDEVLKDKLSSYGNKEKIVVIPHGVEVFSHQIEQNQAKKKLGLKENDFVILYFGYLAWYKGTDLLINFFDELKNIENIKLIIAGGANPNHKNKTFYQKYTKEIEAKCKEIGIILTGFVSEDDIPLYFNSSDLVVFPYRTLMSASGPLSIAFSFGKPFILSETLSPLLNTKDINNSLKEEKINTDEIIYKDKKDFIQKILDIKTNQTFKNKLIKLSLNVKNKRSWNEIGKQYYDEIFTK